MKQTKKKRSTFLDAVLITDSQIQSWQVYAILILALLGGTLFIGGLVTMPQKIGLAPEHEPFLMMLIGMIAFILFFPFFICLIMVKAIADLARKIDPVCLNQVMENKIVAEQETGPTVR